MKRNKINILNMKNRAFTLAETAVVLVLIGVLAVILLSSLINARPERNKTMYKKAYSVIEKTVSELVNDETLYPYDAGKLGFINDMKVIVPGGDGTQTTEGKEKFYTLFKDKLNIAEEHGEKSSATDCSSDVFVTSDGIAWCLPEKYTFARGSKMEIVVDINGFDKPQNRFGDESDTEGNSDDQVDRFKILVSFDGKVGVEGRVEKKFLLSQSLKKGD